MARFVQNLRSGSILVTILYKIPLQDRFLAIILYKNPLQDQFWRLFCAKFQFCINKDDYFVQFCTFHLSKRSHLHKIFVKINMIKELCAKFRKMIIVMNAFVQN